MKNFEMYFKMCLHTRAHIEGLNSCLSGFVPWLMLSENNLPEIVYPAHPEEPFNLKEIADILFGNAEFV